MVQVVSTDGESIAISAKNEHVQIGPREGDSTGKGERAPMNVVSAMGLDEIGKPAGAANSRHGGNFFVPDLPLLNQLEIEGEDRKVAAARTPRWVIGGDILLSQRLSLFRGQRRNGWNGINAGGDFWGGGSHVQTLNELNRLHS